MEKPHISFETERLCVRNVLEADKGLFMALRKETSRIAPIYAVFPAFGEVEWEGELNGERDVFLSVFLKENGAFVASASFQEIDTNDVELGFDVVKERRNQGIATELVKGMLKEARSRWPEKGVFARTGAENAACRKVLENCGGAFAGYVQSPEAQLASVLGRGSGPDELQADAGKTNEIFCVYRFPAP